MRMPSSEVWANAGAAASISKANAVFMEFTIRIGLASFNRHSFAMRDYNVRRAFGVTDVGTGDGPNRSARAVRHLLRRAAVARAASLLLRVVLGVAPGDPRREVQFLRDALERLHRRISLHRLPR